MVDAFLELLDLVGECIDEVQEPLGDVVEQVVGDHADGLKVPALGADTASVLSELEPAAKRAAGKA